MDQKKEKKEQQSIFNSERVFLVTIPNHWKSVFGWFDTSRLGLTEGEATDRLRFMGSRNVREKRIVTDHVY